MKQTFALGSTLFRAALSPLDSSLTLGAASASAAAPNARGREISTCGTPGSATLLLLAAVKAASSSSAAELKSAAGPESGAPVSAEASRAPYLDAQNCEK